MATIEWWPDYRQGPLWLRTERGGVPADLDDLRLPEALSDRLGSWVSSYDDDKLPIEGPGDPEWVEQGIRLLAEVREQLQGRFDVIVTEPWWGEEPSD